MLQVFDKCSFKDITTREMLEVHSKLVNVSKMINDHEQNKALSSAEVVKPDAIQQSSPAKKSKSANKKG